MRRDLAIKHLDQRMAEWQPVSKFACPPRGWIRAIREAIGMTAAQLASRLKVSQPRVFTLEKDEVRGAVTLETLSRTAQALNCTFVYALVPNTTLENMVSEQVQKKISEQFSRVNHAMKLEAQELSEAEILAEQNRMLIEQLKSNLRGVWN